MFKKYLIILWSLIVWTVFSFAFTNANDFAWLTKENYKDLQDRSINEYLKAKNYVSVELDLNKLEKYQESIDKKYWKIIEERFNTIEKLINLEMKIWNVLKVINNSSKYTEKQKEMYNYILVALLNVVENKIQEKINAFIKTFDKEMQELNKQIEELKWDDFF